MRRVGHDDIFARITSFSQTGADQHQAGQLALRAGGGLQAHLLHAADLGKHALELVKQRQGALQKVRRRQRMDLRKAGKTRDDFVDLGIVFHRARAERIKLAFDGEIALRQAGEMTQHFKLAQLGKAGDIAAQQTRQE